MSKCILVASFVTLVCTPAFADTPAPPGNAMQLDLALHFGKDTRNYTLKLVPEECSVASSKAGQSEDNIRICAHSDGARIQLHVNWWSREGDHEMRNDSTTVVARGSSFELVGDGAKLDVATR